MAPNGRQEGGMQKECLIELRKFVAVLPEMSLGGKKVKCIPGGGNNMYESTAVTEHCVFEEQSIAGCVQSTG